MSDRVKLTQLRRGQRATLAGTTLGEDDAMILRALGLRPDSELSVRRAGATCIVAVSCTGCTCRIGMSRDLAECVLVHPAG